MYVSIYCSKHKTVLGSVAVHLPSNENNEANKLPTANDSLNWQYIFFLNKLGLGHWRNDAESWWNISLHSKYFTNDFPS